MQFDVIIMTSSIWCNMIGQFLGLNPIWGHLSTSPHDIQITCKPFYKSPQPLEYLYTFLQVPTDVRAPIYTCLQAHTTFRTPVHLSTVPHGILDTCTPFYKSPRHSESLYTCLQVYTSFRAPVNIFTRPHSRQSNCTSIQDTCTLF